MADKTFGKELRAARKMLEMTQQELADRFGTTKNTIARWERGEMIPDMPDMVRLALYGLECETGQTVEEFEAWKAGIAKSMQSVAETEAQIQELLSKPGLEHLP